MTHTPYEQILSSNTKDDLVAIRDFFGVEIPKNKRKEEIKEAILKRFHEDPVKVLWNLPTYELLLLSDLAREGKGGYIDYPETEFVLFSGMFNMLDVRFPEENESGDEDIMRLSFNDDIYDWFAPHIDEALKLQDKTMRRDFEHFFWGCLTLYGVLTEQEFLGLIEQHYEGMLAAPFYANLHRFAAFDYCFEFYEGRNYLCHPAVQDDLPQILENREKRGQAKSKLSQFPLGDILTAGATAPYSCCLVNKPQGKNLFQLLLKAGYDKHQAPMVMTDFWLEKQLPGLYGSSINQMASNLLEGRHFRKESDARALVDALMEYCNSVPLWIFKGRSSHEMFQNDPQKEEKIAAAGAMMSQMQRRLLEASAFPKVGRNDPCPCGSGLKYKNCHGKNLN